MKTTLFTTQVSVFTLITLGAFILNPVTVEALEQTSTLRKDVKVQKLVDAKTSQVTGYKIIAALKMGLNKCESKNAIEKVETYRTQDDTITVDPIIDGYDGSYACTEEYQPVYKEIAIQIKNPTGQLSPEQVVLKNVETNVNGESQDLTLQDILNDNKSSASIAQIQITKVKAEVTEAWYHGQTKVKVEGTVQIGNNGCDAKGKKAKLLLTTSEGRTYLAAYIISSLPPRLCTYEFSPVYADVAQEVMVPADNPVFIKNAVPKKPSTHANQEFISIMDLIE